MLWHILHSSHLLTSIHIYTVRYGVPLVRLEGRANIHSLWRCLLDSFDSSWYFLRCLISRSNSRSGSGKLICVAGKILDRDYRVIAKAQGFSIDRVGGDDLANFPIEHARLRTHKYSIIICAALLATYGWILHFEVVNSTFATFGAFSSQD